MGTTVREERNDWPYLTVVSIAGIVHRCIEAFAGFPGTTFRWTTSHGYSELALAADEGITWIRGWHDDDSEPVHAMLAARALGPSKALDLDEASAAFVGGNISLDAWKQNLDRWDVEFEEQMKAQR